MLKPMRIFVLIGIFIGAWMQGSFAVNADLMQFEIYPPIKPIEIFGNASAIYASGPIDKDAPARLAKLIEQYDVKNSSWIFFNSPGGNLNASMELGRLIRSHHFTSYIGTKGKESDILFQNAPGWEANILMKR